MPRFDFNPTTLACKGLLIEESRTNLLLNSLLNGTNLATQLVTTTAAAHTLSFYGTGQIVLTGTSSATVVGTGAYPSRKTLTFTPTAGVLTLTVTGTVQYAQLEVGAFATSFIPTAATAVTRNADSAVMTGTNFSSWFNVSQGTFVCSYANIVSAYVFMASNLSNSDRFYLRYLSAQSQFFPTVSNVNGTSAFSGSGLNQNTAISACGYNATNIQIATLSGQTGASFLQTLASVPVGLDRLSIGSFAGTSSFVNGHIAKFNYYPQYLTANELKAFSK